LYNNDLAQTLSRSFYMHSNVTACH